MIRTYSELIRIPTFKERFDYLKLNGQVGSSTFGLDRYLNQYFYQDKYWKRIRRDVIIRDYGCDLGIEDRLIGDFIVVHHINPISIDDIVNREPWILDPEFLICAGDRTHKAIHYGDENLLIKDHIERRPGDTKLW